MTCDPALSVLWFVAVVVGVLVVNFCVMYAWLRWVYERVQWHTTAACIGLWTLGTSVTAGILSIAPFAGVCPW